MLTKNEKDIIMQLKHSRIPSIFKLDDTDNILFIEHVDFDLCNLLLKNKTVDDDFVQNELKEFSTFLSQLNLSNLDEESRNYLNTLMKVVVIFINTNL